MTNNYKKLLAPVFALLITVSAFAQLPNAGFENWQSVGFPSYLQPTNWGTLNSSTSIIGVYTAERADSLNSHSGRYAMKLSTKFISFANQTAPGITVSSATINTNTQAIDGGFIYTQRPTHLSGWIKGTPAANDSSQIELTLWKWISGVKTEIGTAKFVNSIARSSYVRFLAPITYTNPANPDSALIIMSSSNTDNPVDGSVFYVDDLAFVDCNAFTASSSSTNATCTAADGTATVTAAGATSYVWSTTATTPSITAAAGTYTVTATNVDGCTASSSANINATTTTVTSTITATATTCGASTGSATVTPTNGTASYTYVWNVAGSTNSISNLSAGNYQVTITDANGCSGTASTSVTTPNGPSATEAVTNVTCNGAADGAIDITTTGGTAPITYTWNPASTDEDIDSLAGGTYTLTITDDNNCSFTVSVVVSEPAVLTATAAATNLACNGNNSGSIDLTVAGGSPFYAYLWSNDSTTQDLSNLPVGNFSVTVTDANSCTTQASATLTEPTAVTVTLTPTNASSSTATDGSITAVPAGGTNPYSINWGGGNNGQNLAAGNYTVTVTDGNGCSTTASATVGFNTGITTTQLQNVNLYPNPANNQLTIETGSAEGKFSFTVYSIDGKLVSEKTISGEKVLVDVKQLAVGFYSYQLKNVTTGNTGYGKLQIQR
jgi:hypothetical protein